MCRFAKVSVAFVVLAVLALTACTSDEAFNEQGLGEPTAASEPAGSGSDDTGSDEAQTDNAPEWLFAVQAEGESSFDPATGRLSMPTSSVEAFTDRPYRDTRTLEPQAFANLFRGGGSDSFAEDPPNAVMTYWDETTPTPTPRSVVCEVNGGAGLSDGQLWVGLKILEPAGATLPARLSRASLFVDDVPLSGCPNSPEDEAIIEYFNEIEFSEDVYVIIVDTGTTFQLSLSCPPQQSPYFPPPNFEIQMATSDKSSSITCNTGQFTIQKPTLAQQTFCSGNDTCTFEVTVLNEATSAVYSTTEIQLELTNGNNTYIPNLNPATLPLCPSTFNPCVLTGQCAAAAG